MAIETFNPNWTQVEEKLPEFDGIFFVTYYDEETKQYYSDEARFWRWGNKTEWYDWEGNTYGFEPLSDCHVVAWAEMPKITPYNQNQLRK